VTEQSMVLVWAFDTPAFSNEEKRLADFRYGADR
jgi:hypothetical protein